MTTINFEITFEFFKESLNRLIDFNKQVTVLGNLFDADIYGGPMKGYSDELNMWNKILNNDEKFDIFVAFAGDIVDSNFSRKTLIYDTCHAPVHIGELVEQINYTDEEYTCPRVDKCIISYPKGKDKYEYIWEILCS